MWYEMQYRESGEQMLGSVEFDNEDAARNAFDNASFTGDCDVIELWEIPDDEDYNNELPMHFQSELIGTRAKSEECI